MKSKNKTRKIILIGLPVLIFGFAVYVWLTAPDYDYYVGKDTVDVFGDGRFQMGKTMGHIGLDDHGCDLCPAVVHNVENYVEIDNFIYVIGYYSRGFTVDDNDIEKSSLSHLNLETCEYEWFDSYDEIPRYLILNYEKAELETYVDFEDIPEEDKEVFEELKSGIDTAS